MATQPFIDLSAPGASPAPHRRPLLCRLGLHSYHTDSAMFNSARRCNNCDHPQDTAGAERLDRERQLWSSGPPGETIGQAMARVGRGLAGLPSRPGR
jgi:hypothetical protein